MPVSNPDLWAVIRDWPLPFRRIWDAQCTPARWCSCFEHSLRKIGDWTDEASVQITEAYRRFLYLKALTGELMTPPKWIDQAWHLHLEFGEDYSALEMALGRSLPHTEYISRTEAKSAYGRARALWAVEFDAMPEAKIWPSIEHTRFEWIGGSIALLGWAMIMAGVVTSVLAERPLFWIFGIGFVLFFSGGFIAGKNSPDTVSRCG